jgi:hypothetical protein
MNFWKPAAVAVCCAFVAACGSESGAPQGGTIVVTPPEQEWFFNIENDSFPGDNSLTSADLVMGPLTTYQVKVLGPNGFPINDVNITVELAPACEIYAGEVSEDPNGTLNVNGDVNAVTPTTGAVVQPLIEPVFDKVGEFGTATYSIRCVGGAGRQSDDFIRVFSGAASGEGVYKVSCVDEDTVFDAFECPGA